MVGRHVVDSATSYAEAADPVALANSLQVDNKTGPIPGPPPSLAEPLDRTSARQGGHERRRRRPQGVALTGGEMGTRNWEVVQKDFLLETAQTTKRSQG